MCQPYDGPRNRCVRPGLALSQDRCDLAETANFAALNFYGCSRLICRLSERPSDSHSDTSVKPDRYTGKLEKRIAQIGTQPLLDVIVQSVDVGDRQVTMRSR